MLADLTPSSPRIVRHVHFCRMWRVVSWVLLPFCYLGALIAPGVILAIPFQVFHAHKYPASVFWVTAVLMGAFVVWMLCKMVVRGLHVLRQGVIYVEAIVFIAGLLLAVVAVIWIYPPK